MSYYRMHRGWMDSPAFRKTPYSHREAWCWLIENAAWAKTRVPVEGGVQTLERGQLSHSLRYLARAWAWKSDKRVRVFLRRLEDEGMVRIERSLKTDAGKDAGQNVVTLCNYEKYQAPQVEEDASPDAVRTQQGRKEEEIYNSVPNGTEQSSPSRDQIQSNLLDLSPRRDEQTEDLPTIAPVPDLAARIFGDCRELLVSRYGYTDGKARKFLGGLRKIYDDDGRIIEAFSGLQSQPDIQDPAGWLNASLRKISGNTQFEPKADWERDYEIACSQGRRDEWLRDNLPTSRHAGAS